MKRAFLLIGLLFCFVLFAGFDSNMVPKHKHPEYDRHLKSLEHKVNKARGKPQSSTIGDKGPTGDKGPSGDSGSKGPDGDKGPTGDKGATGDKGQTGDPGATGSPGANGSPGADGNKGADGDKGPTGDQGPVGDKGPAGDPASFAEASISGVSLDWTSGVTLPYLSGVTQNVQLALNSNSTLGYALRGNAASQSTTTDSQTLYWGGMLVAPSTTAARWRVYIPKGGTITAAYVYSYSGTAGTNENWSVYIRKNNTTDYLIQTLAANTNDRVWSNTAMNVPVAQGDYVEIKEVFPAWATNPATVTRSFVFYVQ